MRVSDDRKETWGRDDTDGFASVRIEEIINVLGFSYSAFREVFGMEICNHSVMQKFVEFDVVCTAGDY